MFSRALPPPSLRRRLRSIAVAATLAASALVPLAGAQSAQAGPVPFPTRSHVDDSSLAGPATCEQWGTLPVAGGEYTLQNNVWNSTDEQCVTYDGGTAWTVTKANFNLPTAGPPATYPSLYKGCHWGSCTAGSNLPIQVSELGSATSSWSTVQPASGAYNAAYDLWFNSTPTTTGQPDGTELMIWLDSRGGVQPFGSRTGTFSAGGRTWDVWTGQQSSWKIISYVLQGGTTSVTDLNIKTLIDDAATRGSVNRSHYLIDAEAGFEIWQGGQGLATTEFSFNAAPADGDGGGDGGGGGSSGCTAAYHVDHQWAGGFTATVTVTNEGSSPTPSWQVAWTWSGDQKVTNMWNAVGQQNGQTQSAANAGYNGVIAPGSSTSFGLQATYSGANSAPTPTCTTG
jgi:hypothetical protein